MSFDLDPQSSQTRKIICIEGMSWVGVGGDFE